MECVKNGYDRYVNNLNSEIEIMRNENCGLKQRLDELEQTYSEERALERCLDHENHLLKHDLTAAERISRSMQQEKDQVLIDTELELTKMQKRMKQMEIDTETMHQEKEGVSGNLSELQQSSKMIEFELQDSRELLTRLQDDKLRLSQRVDKLTANERALVLEIERLKRHAGNTKNGHTKISQTEQYMRGIEQDRDYWKGEAELLRGLQRQLKRSSSVAAGSGSRSPVRGVSSAGAGGKETKISGKSVRKGSTSKDKRVKELEREKVELKKQLDSLRQEKTATPVRGRSPSPGIRGRSPARSTRMNSGIDEDVTQLKRERDDLRNLLNKLEKRVGEIQSSVRLLTQEKDRYSQLYEEARKELHYLHHELVAAQEDGGRATCEAKKLLSRIETDRDSLQNELTRVQAERDGLLERYKATIDTASNDKYLLEQKIADLQCNIKDSRSEKKDMTSRMESLRGRILDLESELKNLEIGTHQNLSELETEKEKSEQTQQRLQKSQLLMESAERQVVQLTSQLTKADQTVCGQEQRIAGLMEDLRIQRDDFSRLRGEANRLDEDKDQLKSTLNEASLRLHQLETDLCGAEEELQQTRTNLCMAEQQLGRVSETLGARDKDNRQLRKRAEQSQGNSEELQRKLNILSRDNDRIHEELEESKRAGVALDRELAETVDEREELRAQTQAYVAEVGRAEAALSEHERGLEELARRLDGSDHRAEEERRRGDAAAAESTQLSRELAALEEELARTRCCLETGQSQLQDSQRHARDLEGKTSQLSLVASQNKEQLRQIQQERDDLMGDLAALRDLCGRLERGKTELDTELEQRSLDLAQTRAGLDDADAETETLREELDAERERIQDLQAVLEASRGQEQASASELQDRTTELALASDKMQMTEERQSQAEREVTRLRSRLGDLERETERLQRALTNERFEKDRAMSELRIQSLSSPSYKPSHLTNGAHRSSSPCRTCSP